MMYITDLKPTKIWYYFNEICQIPRPSKNEDKIIAYLHNFAKVQNLEFKTDKTGNVLITKPATSGMENRKKVILQSHLDMVCEKNSSTLHDFYNDPIQPFISENWVKAKGTTLGADDGIGIAAQLAILASDDIDHGPIECLFTVDEETGLTGAFALEPGFLSGEILINLDSEDEGEIFMGCAGGVDTIATLHYYAEETPLNMQALRVSVYGLTGGHSGDDINKGLANANKVLNRFLWESSQTYALRLASFNGGNLRNAIAREAEAVVLVHTENANALIASLSPFMDAIKSIYSDTESGFDMAIESVEKPETIIDRDAQNKLLNLIYACPHGVLAMSNKISGLVETSTNLASVKMKGKDQIELVTSQRSSVEAAKKGAMQMVRSVFSLAGTTVRHSDGYPGWQPNLDSAILRITETAYIKLFGVEPKIKAIHAGLECGLFLEKYPYLDMVSIGPTIKGAHSPDERLEIETVDKFWKLTLELLKMVPEK